MIRYSKYKNFIPIDFVNKKYLERQKGNKLGVYALVLLNFFLLPINIDNLFYHVEVVESKYNVEEFSYNYLDICKWLRLSNISPESIRVNDEVGEVVFTDINAIKDIEKNGFLIKKLRVEDDNIIVNLKGDRVYEEK
jgi:hypothetical protein